MKVKFKIFSSLAHVPKKSTPDPACYDVYSTRDVELGQRVTKTVELDLGFKFQKKYVCRIYPRSGLSLKPLFLGDRVIDSDYRGNISVILTNPFSFAVNIKKGDKVSQIIFLQKEAVTFEEVDEFDDTTIHGVKGFGSTDWKQV